MEQVWANFGPVWEWGKSTLALLGLGGVTVGGAAAVGYGLFKWLGEKWIDQKFKKQMETYKIEQSRELERLRHKINGVFDRTIRLHTKEFEVLPDLWGKLVEAHAWGANYISALQEYADVGRMDDEELEEYLAGTTFMEVQKRDIRDAPNGSERLKTFTKISDLYRHNEAAEKIRIFATSLRKDGIFVKPEIKADMDELLKLIRDAVLEKRMNEEDDIRPRLRDEFKRFKNEAQQLLEKIEAMIADRLWDSTTTEV
ncbi:hypothetical protein [Sinorhizobium meliloti]|uniref:hypothetical protein n=1 Tax=Rhizobium meliloti TaxID=382 RepID=UPI0012955624|nr:hypothetical protein [Sinorhizobium meliloti]MQX70111.1 hypothetical protein [Sinorhizobium meliloti]